MPLVTIPPQPYPPSSGKTGDITERVAELETEVSGLETNVINLQSDKANKTTIAPTFSAESSYNIGDLVFYNGILYKCTTAHEGAWDETNFTVTTIENELNTLNTDLNNLQTTKANQITIAPTFSNETAYTVGDIVYYNGLTYKCTTNHTGAWDAGDFTATTIANELQNSGSGVVDYSTTEHETGEKWIDGKDIYRKVFVFENIPAATPASMPHGITNLGDVVVLIGTGVLSDRIIALPYVDDIATYQRAITVKDGSITITGYANSAAVGKATIIMKYTKSESEV